jgi:hypothetical protein
MADGRSGVVSRPARKRGRWNSFVAVVVSGGRRSRALCEEGNPHHRVRVEYDSHTILIHLSDEGGHGWTTVAVDRETRAWSIAQRDSQLSAASEACTGLYGSS